MIHSITFQAGTARRRGGWLLRSRREHDDDLRIVDGDGSAAPVAWPGLVAWRSTGKGVHLLLTSSAPTPRGADPRFDRLSAARGYYDEWISDSATEAVIMPGRGGEKWLSAHRFALATTGQVAKPISAPLRGRR